MAKRGLKRGSLHWFPRYCGECLLCAQLASWHRHRREGLLKLLVTCRNVIALHRESEHNCRSVGSISHLLLEKVNRLVGDRTIKEDHLCFDHGKLNSATRKEAIPLLHINNLTLVKLFLHARVKIRVRASRSGKNGQKIYLVSKRALWVPDNAA